MGWTNVFQVEKDEWCQGKLAKHFPDTERYLDIKEFSGEKYSGAIDIISAGFPCQPFSQAGKQKGKEDDRYLWPETMRVISEIRPTYVLGENVPGIISMALDQVLSDLEGEGYACQTFIIPACAVNAIHRRDRVWIIAYRSNTGSKKMCERPIGSISSDSKHNGCTPSKIERSLGKTIHESQARSDDSLNAQRTSSVSRTENNVSDSDVRWDRRCERESIQEGTTSRSGSAQNGGGYRRIKFPVSQPTIRRGNDGISYRLDDGSMISSNQRRSALKGLGNAVVPQVVYELFKIIERFEATL